MEIFHIILSIPLANKFDLSFLPCLNPYTQLESGKGFCRYT